MWMVSFSKERNSSKFYIGIVSFVDTCCGTMLISVDILSKQDEHNTIIIVLNVSSKTNSKAKSKAN